MAIKEDFLSLITQTNLPQEDKALWEKVLPLMEDEQVKILSDFVHSNSQHLIFFTENLKSKKEALLKNDQEWLKWIEEKEEEYMNGLEEK